MKNTIKTPRISAELKKYLVSLIGIIALLFNSNLFSFLGRDSGKNSITNIIERRLTPAAKKKGAEKFMFNNTPPIIGPKISPAPKTALE